MVDILVITNKLIVMKKTFIFVMALAILTLISCQKEAQEGSGKFKVKIERVQTKDGKVSFDMSNGFCWQSGDQIKVCRTDPSNSNKVKMGTYTIEETSVSSQSGNYAIFNYSEGTDITNSSNGTGDYVAYYPAGIRGTAATQSSNAKIILPTVQTATMDGKMQGMPMYAVSSNLTLEFENMCGILRLHLSGSVGDAVSTIRITTDNSHPIAGTFSRQTTSDGKPYVIWSSVANNEVGTPNVTLRCPTPQDISGAGKDFCIYLPTGNYPYMEIRIWTDDDRMCKKVFRGGDGTDGRPENINIARSCYTSVLFEGISFTSMGRGAFRIDTAGTRVMFSPGNLQYDLANERYLFAEHDYDCLSSANVSNLANNGVIDLFGWGTGNNPTASPTGTSFVDWGTNVIYQATGSWRTLTKNEWVYLLNRRGASTIGSVKNGRYAKAVVGGAHGLIIFPDEYEHPSGVDIPTGVNSPSNNTGWTGNSYNATDWDKMRLAGAVFLPAAGYYDYNNGAIQVFGVGTSGYYWSSSWNSDNSNPYCLWFEATEFSASSTQEKTRGQSVRLVQVY